MFDGLVSVFSLVLSSIQSIFSIQGVLWDELGVLPTFLLVFVAATFFRYIVVRMFGAGADAVSDSVVSSNRRAAYSYRERVNAHQRIANYQLKRRK